MRMMLLIAISIAAHGADIKINSYDGEGGFNLKDEQKTVSDTAYDVQTLSYNDTILFKSSTADNGIATRYSGTNIVFVSSLGNKDDKLIISWFRGFPGQCAACEIRYRTKIRSARLSVDSKAS